MLNATARLFASYLSVLRREQRPLNESDLDSVRLQLLRELPHLSRAIGPDSARVHRDPDSHTPG